LLNTLTTQKQLLLSNACYFDTTEKQYFYGVCPRIVYGGNVTGPVVFRKAIPIRSSGRKEG
jgi:hypothetical protein